MNPAYNGDTDQNLLLAGATLDPGQSATIRVVLRLNAVALRRVT